MFSQPHHNIEQLDIHPGMKVLECGVGAGEYALFAAQRAGSQGTVYVADIQKKLLERISRTAEEHNLTNIKTLWADLDQKQGLSLLENSSVDRIVVANILFQLEHVEGLFDECFRVLKKDGKLLCIDWSDSFNQIGPHPDHIVHQDKAQHAARQGGFDSIAPLDDVGPHHYGFIAKPSQ